MTCPRSKPQSKKGKAGFLAAETTSPVIPTTTKKRRAPHFPGARTQCGGAPHPPACTPRRSPAARPPPTTRAPGPHVPRGSSPGPERPDPGSGPQKVKCPQRRAPLALPATSAGSRTMALQTRAPATAVATGPGSPGLPVPASPGQREPKQASDFL